MCSLFLNMIHDANRWWIEKQGLDEEVGMLHTRLDVVMRRSGVEQMVQEIKDAEEMKNKSKESGRGSGKGGGESGEDGVIKGCDRKQMENKSRKSGRSSGKGISGKENANAYSCFVLFLSLDLEGLPWEMLSMFRRCVVTRMTSVQAFFSRLHEMGAYSREMDKGGNPGESKSLRLFSKYPPPLLPTYSRFSSAVSSFLSSSLTFSFVIDPTHDSPGLEDLILFQGKEFSQREKEGKGAGATAALSRGGYVVVGEPPTKEGMQECLRNSDVYCYCGHGNGNIYYEEEQLRKHARTPLTMLMGCSSGVRYV
jgi:hypothetical protein